MTARLPTVGGDGGNWGTVLNTFLSVSLASDGTLNSGIVSDANVSASAGIQSTKLSSATQTSLGLANTSVQTVNSISPTSGALTLTAANVGALTQTTADGRYVQGVEQTSAPGSPTTNELWYDSTNDLWKRWNGSAWVVAGSNSYTPNSLPSGITGSRRYNPSTFIYGSGGGNLSHIQAKLAKSLAGVSQTRIAVLGDSFATHTAPTVAGSRNTVAWPVRLRNMMAAAGYPIGAGAVTFNDSNDLDSRASYSGSGWYWTASTADLYNTYITGTAGNSVTITFDEPGTVVEWAIYGQSQTSDTWSYSIDSAAPTIVHFSGSSTIAPEVTTITGLSNTTHTLTLQLVSTSGAILSVAWADSYPTNGVSITNFGLYGSSTYWAWDDSGGVLAYDFLQTTVHYNADLYLIELGANDYDYPGLDVPTITTSLEYIVSQVTAAGAEVALVMPTAYTGMTPPTYTTAWHQMYYSVADALGVPLLDLYDRWQSLATTEANGMTGTDNSHPSLAGHIDRAIAYAGLFNLAPVATTSSSSGGGEPTNFVTKTSAYTASANDFVLANASGGTFAVTLPASPAVGAQVGVKKIDSSLNQPTVVASSSGTIDGDSSATLASQWAGGIFEHQGSNVWTVSAVTVSSAGFTGATGTTGATGSTGAAGVNATALATLSSTAATTSTTDTKLLSAPVSAGLVTAGQVIRFKLFGTSSSTGTVTFKVHVGAAGTTSDTTGWTSLTSAAQVANQRAGIDGMVVVRTTGSSGTVEVEALGYAQAALLPTVVAAVTTPTVNTTALWYITLSAACSSGTFTAQSAEVVTP